MDKRSKNNIGDIQAQDYNEVVLMLGANLGDREANLNNAIEFIEKDIGPVKKQSSVYETEPWGLRDQPAFYNIALIVITALSPAEVLEKALAIEACLGRDRSTTKKGGERLIDIDILFYENEIISEPDLQIPHPAIQARNFVLIPLNEVIPTYFHPQKNDTISSLLDKCKDVLQVKKVKIKLKNHKN